MKLRDFFNCFVNVFYWFFIFSIYISLVGSIFDLTVILSNSPIQGADNLSLYNKVFSLFLLLAPFSVVVYAVNIFGEYMSHKIDVFLSYLKAKFFR